MTAVRAMEFTGNTIPVLFFHPPEGLICLVHQEFIAAKQLRGFHF
jgi:hypothetical protein